MARHPSFGNFTSPLEMTKFTSSWFVITRWVTFSARFTTWCAGDERSTTQTTQRQLRSFLLLLATTFRVPVNFPFGLFKSINFLPFRPVWCHNFAKFKILKRTEKRVSSDAVLGGNIKAIETDLGDFTFYLSLMFEHFPSRWNSLH